MRHILKTAAVISGLSLTIGSVTAYAGNCGGTVRGPECQTQVVVHPGVAPSMDPMHVYSSQPMGHLRTVEYLGTPSVNITRVHGMGPTAGLTDAPTGFTDGCLTESTNYCRQGGMQPQAMPMMAPMPAPVIAQPAPISQPVERVVHVGGGYDPSKFIPRTYGSLEPVPGIAHVPTSIVDRSHANAQAVLNSGRTQPQALASGGIAPHPSMMAGGSMHGTMSGMGMTGMGQSAMVNPMMSGSMMPQQIGMQSEIRTMAPQGNVYPGGEMSGNGTYWEKVSGPTMMGNTMATQIICKRQAEQVRVERPVYGVPVPVPTAVPMCERAPMPMAMPHLAGGRYGH